MQLHRQMRSRGCLALVVGGCALIAAPAAAGAASLTGLTTVTLDGVAAKRLAKSGVKTTVSTPAQLASGRLILPVQSGTVAGSTKVAQAGTLTLRRKAGGRTRVLTVKQLRLELGSRRRVVTGVFDGRRRTFLELDLRTKEYSAVAAASTVQVNGARASLSKVAAQTIARKLSIRGFKASLYGVLGTNAGPRPTASVGGGTAGAVDTPGSTGSSPTGGVTGPIISASGSSFPDPGTLARPAGAVDVAASMLTWNVRESFVRYINTEAAPAVADGAVAGTPKVVAPVSVPLVYDYGFQPAGGWFDAATGKARLLFKGKVTFSYPSHGIDFDVVDPEVELDGASGSRVIATFGGRRATPYSGRTALISLDPTKTSPSVNGGTRAYAAIPGSVPPSASGGVFAGFYASGDPFGAIALSLTTPG